MRSLIIGVSIVALLAIGAFILVNSNNNDADNDSDTQATTETTESTSENGQNTTNPDTGANNETASSAVTITFTSSGFTPSAATVVSGGTVTVRNDSSRTIQFASDPHPAHTENSELNLGTVDAGQSRSFTVTTKGTWGYHDHLNATEIGTLQVQ